MSIPESLRLKMELYQSHGRIYGEPDTLFAEGGWVQVMHGQGLRPRGYNPIVDVLDIEDIASYFDNLRDSIQKCVRSMPTHEEFINRHCKAAGPATSTPRYVGAAQRRN
jgi:tryptophan halogenase